jgi:hypothetical protein
VVLPPQRRAWPAALDRQGREGEGRLLVARPIALLVSSPTGLSFDGAEGAGGRRADHGLGSRQPPPPADRRRLHIFEMEETADPVALAQSRLQHDLFPWEYAATRARRAVNLNAMRVDDTALWAFTMLPEGPLVSRVPTPLRFLGSRSIVVIWGSPCFLQVMVVTPRGPTRPHPDPEHARARRSSESKSGRRARRRGVSGGGSAGNRGARSSGCMSSRGSPPLGLRSTRRRTRRRRKRAMGVGLPPRGGSLRPPCPESRRRQKRRRLGRARASYERGDARRGDGWGRGGGHAGGGYNAHRAPEEEETRIFHPEVGDCFPSAASFRSARA